MYNKEKNNLEIVEDMLLENTTKDYDFIGEVIIDNELYFFNKLFSEKYGITKKYPLDLKVYVFLFSYMRLKYKNECGQFYQYICNQIENDNIDSNLISLANSLQHYFYEKLVKISEDKLCSSIDQGFQPIGSFVSKFVEINKKINPVFFAKILNSSNMYTHDKNLFICKNFSNDLIENLTANGLKVTRSFVSAYCERIVYNLFDHSTFKKILEKLDFKDKNKYYEKAFKEAVRLNNSEVLDGLDYSKFDINNNLKIPKYDHGFVTIKSYIISETPIPIFELLIRKGYILDQDFFDNYLESKLKHNIKNFYSNIKEYYTFYLSQLIEWNEPMDVKLPYFEYVINDIENTHLWNDILYSVAKYLMNTNLSSKVLNVFIKSQDHLSILHLLEFGYELSSENAILMKKDKRCKIFVNILENRYPDQYEKVFHHFM